MFNIIGYNGPVILLIVVFFLQTPYIFTNLIIWQLLGSILNIGLKNLIKQPRPKCNGLKRDTSSYGMPSGHAQQSFTTLTFIMLTMKNMWVIIFALIQTLITLWQRHAYCKHSIPQLIVGGIIGILLGYYFTTMISSNNAT